MLSVSIIIPVYNEEESLQLTLERLQPFRLQGCEIILADGGSEDKTCDIAGTLVDKIVPSSKGRAQQMNNAAAHAIHDVLWFLHADTLAPENAIDVIEAALVKSDWGRFNVKLSGNLWLFRLIERSMNLRSCLTGIATGDQGIFVKRKLFDSIKGYADILLMEDIELSKKLKAVSNPVCLKDELVTSSRRWEEKGILTTILLMWKLRFLYFIGVSADKLAQQYR